MKKLYAFIALTMVLVTVGLENAAAQDTLWVQTYTFDSLKTRRAKFYFPTAGQHFRKILMYYKLKCYNGVSGDGNYPCGEWDYLAFHNVYDHRGALDSTKMTGNYFKINGTAPDSLRYVITPQYDIFQAYQYNRIIDATTSFTDYLLGGNTTAMPHPVNLAAGKERSQFIWKASEITTSGLTAGNITGLKLNFQNASAIIRNLRIRMKNIQTDSFDVAAMKVDTLQDVYYSTRTINAAGWNSFQFTNTFVWDGTSNILVDFSFENTSAAADNPLLGETLSYPAGIYSNTGNYSLGAYNNAGGCLKFDQTLNMFTGAQARTYEAWVSVDSFASSWGGVFSGGITGTNKADFSLLTTTPDNNWKFNLWANDYTFSAPNMKKVWKQVTLTYDGTTARIYFNGDLVAQTTKAAGTINTNNFYMSGWGGPGSFLLGKFSHLRIWDVALSQQDIRNWVGKDITAAHPQYAHLKADYRLNNGTGATVSDASPLGQLPGTLNQQLWWKKVAAADFYYNAQKLSWRPQVRFERGVYTAHLDSVLVADTLYNEPVFVDFYEHPDGNHIINDNDPANPANQTSRRILWAHKWTYTYRNGVKVDSAANPLDSVIYNRTTNWYSNTVAYEIGRAITPYGINLNMGTGKTWVYDLTDYYPILQDTVDLAVGGTQELQDVRFAFIQGNPPAEVSRITQPWHKGWKQFSYASLANNTAIPALNIPLASDASEFKIKTIITGHGGAENTNGSTNPNGCCEFMYNTHYLYANSQQIKSWRIERMDCALNPLYPQGGTWVYHREGWCPGDIVWNFDYRVTPYAAGGSLNLDYGISAIPSGNPNLGNGVYDVSLQLIQYKTPSRNNDAEVYSVRKPSDEFYYSRMNPICSTPEVVLRNSGKNALTAAVIKYKVSGGTEMTYSWTGNLAFLDTTIVQLPTPTSDFWAGDNTKRFMAWIAGANNTTDEYAANDTAFSTYNIPANYTINKIVIAMKTNNFAEENHLRVVDYAGNTVLDRTTLTNNTVYRDTLILAPGCYTLILDDDGEDGLSFWANPDQGTGTISIMRGDAALSLKSFNADFGKQIYFPFTIGWPLHTGNTPVSPNVTVFPNPNNGSFSVEVEGYTGPVHMELTNTVGQVIHSEVIQCYGNAVTKTLDLRVPRGVYFLRLDNGGEKAVHKVTVE